MIDTGYLFGKDSSRLFVNTSLGCTANCSYCYLPNLNYSKGKKLNEEILKNIKSIWTDLEEKITEKEKYIVVNLLKKIKANLKEEK